MVIQRILIAVNYQSPYHMSSHQTEFLFSTDHSLFLIWQDLPEFDAWPGPSAHVLASIAEVLTCNYRKNK